MKNELYTTNINKLLTLYIYNNIYTIYRPNMMERISISFYTSKFEENKNYKQKIGDNYEKIK